MPSGLAIEVNNNNGKVEIDNVTGQLNVRTDNGDVNVLRLDGSLEVRGENGRITVAGVSGTITANNRNGQIRVENPKGDVTAETQNGNIELASNSPLDKTYILNSIHGSLNFRLPGESNLGIEARTRNGSISGMSGNHDSGPAQVKSDRLKLGAGKGSARLSTENGNIQVNVN